MSTPHRRSRCPRSSPDVTPSVADLPGGWARAPYLLVAHGRSAVQAHWRTGDALVVALEGSARSVGVVGLGPAGDVAHLMRRAVADLRDATSVPGGPTRWVTVPRGTWDLLDGATASAFDDWSGPSAWDCMWTRRPLVDVPDHAVERLAPEDPAVRDEVAEALARAHPSASTSPHDSRLVGWWGARVGGRLVAVVGALRYAPGLAPHLVSLGVDPAHRGRGLAGAVLAAAVQDGLTDGTDVGPATVWLGLHANNAVARRVYLRHGFGLGHEFESRVAPA